MTTDPVRVGLAVSTIGRPTLRDLLESLAEGTHHPAAVAVADHTPVGDLVVEGSYPFPVLVVPSTGGASRGRNDGVAALPAECDVLGFPNDDIVYPPDTLEQVVAEFARPPAPAALAATLVEVGVPRFVLPPHGRVLDRRTVWRAIESALFIRREDFCEVGGFREDLGTGADSPWQSGDGTDVLLHLMARGRRVRSAADITVLGRGERKGLPDAGFVAKHRAYARGTGHVYREHGYPWHSRLRMLVGPVAQATRHDTSLPLSLRLALARTLGRLEGLSGRTLPGASEQRWLTPGTPEC